MRLHGHQDHDEHLREDEQAVHTSSVRKRSVKSVVASQIVHSATNIAITRRDAGSVLDVRRGLAQHQDRGDEDEVVEELEPPIIGTRSASSAPSRDRASSRRPGESRKGQS